MRGARPAGRPPRPPTEPVTAQRRASNTGVIMVAGQKIALGRIHAGQTVTVHVAAETITIDLGEDTRKVRRTTTQPVRSIKARTVRKAAHLSLAPVKHVLGLIRPRKASPGTRQKSRGLCYVDPWCRDLTSRLSAGRGARQKLRGVAPV